MKRRKQIILGLVLAMLLPLLGAQPLQAVQRPTATVQQVDSNLDNQWFGYYFQNKKFGFGNEVFEKVTENGQVIYRMRSLAQMKLQTFGQKGVLKIEERLDFDSKAPFALRAGKFRSDDGNSTKSIQVVARDKSYEATIRTGNVSQKKTLPRVDYTLADALARGMWLKKGPALGDAITTSQFALGDLKMKSVTTKVIAIKEIVQDGAKVKVYEVEQLDHQTQGKSIYRYDTQARTISGIEAGLFELRRESAATATKGIEFSGDVLFATLAKIDRPVGKLHKVKGLTLKGKGKAAGLLPDSTLQTVKHEGNDVYVVKIGKHHAKKRAATEKEIQESLQETMIYAIKDAKVIELAKKAVGDAKTDREKVERLVKFVHGYITYKIVLTPNVHDVMEKKVGDCKSYALLFTCLARAVGLPAREAAGYLYLGDTVKGFGGHAWSEVVIDGHWVPVDATIGLTELPPFYICVGTGEQGKDNIGPTLGKLSFELVEVERAA